MCSTNLVAQFYIPSGAVTDCPDPGFYGQYGGYALCDLFMHYNPWWLTSDRWVEGGESSCCTMPYVWNHVPDPNSCDYAIGAVVEEASHHGDVSIIGIILALQHNLGIYHFTIDPPQNPYTFRLERLRSDSTTTLYTCDHGSCNMLASFADIWTSDLAPPPPPLLNALACPEADGHLAGTGPSSINLDVSEMPGWQSPMPAVVTLHLDRCASFGGMFQGPAGGQDIVTADDEELQYSMSVRAQYSACLSYNDADGTGKLINGPGWTISCLIDRAETPAPHPPPRAGSGHVSATLAVGGTCFGGGSASGGANVTTTRYVAGAMAQWPHKDGEVLGVGWSVWKPASISYTFNE